VGRVAADPYNGQEDSDEKQNNDAFDKCAHICV
jgi:hypothetical protein